MFWSPVRDYLLSLLPLDVWIVAFVVLLLMILFKPTRWFTIAGLVALMIT